MDGVLADMESELVRQAEILFGDTMTRRLQERADADSGAKSEAPDPPTDPRTDPQTSAETAPDNVSPLLRLNMTPRQQRKLWRHVESIENFWQTLVELEPGVIARLAAIAAERRREIIFLTKRPRVLDRVMRLLGLKEPASA